MTSKLKYAIQKILRKAITKFVSLKKSHLLSCENYKYLFKQNM